LISDLRVGGSSSTAGVFFNGATGSLVGRVTFRNLGATCALSGRPRVRFAGGAAAHVRQQQLPLRGEPPLVTRPVRHGQTVAVEIWWSNWCGPKSRPASGPGPPPTSVTVTLPSGGAAHLKVTEAPRCDEPADPSTISVDGFRPVR
jgi:hypothetical protein